MGRPEAATPPVDGRDRRRAGDRLPSAADLLAPDPADRDGRLFLTRFLRPERVLASAGFANVDADAATLAGLAAADYADAMEGHRQACEAAADAVVADAELRRGLRQPSGARVLALGDSITEDARSWAEMLRAARARIDGGPTAGVVNAGISGATAATALRALPRLLTCEPQVVVVMIGTNDAQRVGDADALVTSVDEYARLTNEIARAVAARNSGVVWLTPPPVLEARIESSQALTDAGVGCHNADLAALRDVLADRDELVVDIFGTFGDPAPEDYLSSDGLHPSTKGQAAIAAALLAELASQPSLSGGSQ